MSATTLAPARAGNAKRRRLRRSVFYRDNFICIGCGRRFPPPPGWRGEGIEGLTLGHILATSRGGSWRVTNLVAECAPCNEAHADGPPKMNLWEFLR